MSLALVTAPTVEPVTLQEAKDHLRIDGSDDDATVSMLISAARRWCEDYTGRTFVTTTWDWSFDCFDGPVLCVPRPALKSVTSISYVDTAGVTQVLSSAVYRVDTASEPGRIALAYGQTWPSTQSVINAVTVRFVAGYVGVPEHVRCAILMLVGEMFEQRQESVTGTLASVPFGVRELLGTEKLWHY